MIYVHHYIPDDRLIILNMVEHLTIVMPPWRDQQIRLSALEGGITTSIDPIGRGATGA